MAKPNYAFAKRQRDIAKKQKKEEKRRLKAETKQKPAEGEEPLQQPADETTDAWFSIVYRVQRLHLYESDIILIVISLFSWEQHDQLD